jgi:NAD-dependent SIR2 family protein deacetylase
VRAGAPESVVVGQAILSRLERFLAQYPRLFVLTGAGVSTASGIPDYRDGDGAWKRAEPIRFQDFIASEKARRRYWARSMIGWPGFAAAGPNRAHRGIARLEALGHVEQLVTQNVDRLHQAAGNRRVIDLHGRLDRVECLACGHRIPRQTFQQELIMMNPDFLDLDAASAPDGDALLEDVDFETFRVPACACCGGRLKPAVVFFGETVPKDRVALAYGSLRRAEAVLVIGSSLMVYSGFRFCRAAAEQGKPIAAINQGRTRADPLLRLKVDAECSATLGALLERLGSNPDFSPGGSERHEMGLLDKG